MATTPTTTKDQSGAHRFGHSTPIICLASQEDRAFQRAKLAYVKDKSLRNFLRLRQAYTAAEEAIYAQA